MHAFKSLFKKTSPPLINESEHFNVHTEAEREAFNIDIDKSPGISRLFRTWSMTKVNKDDYKSKLNPGYSEENLSKSSYKGERSSFKKEEKASLLATGNTARSTSVSRKSRSVADTSDVVEKSNGLIVSGSIEPSQPLRGELNTTPAKAQMFSAAKSKGKETDPDKTMSSGSSWFKDIKHVVIGKMNVPTESKETQKEEKMIKSYSDYEGDEGQEVFPFEFEPVVCCCIHEQGVRISSPSCVDHGTSSVGCLCDEDPITYKISPSPDCHLHAKWYKRHGTKMPDPNACRCIKYGNVVIRPRGCLQHGVPPQCSCVVGWNGEKIKSPVCDLHSRF